MQMVLGSTINTSHRGEKDDAGGEDGGAPGHHVFVHVPSSSSALVPLQHLNVLECTAGVLRRSLV